MLSSLSKVTVVLSFARLKNASSMIKVIQKVSLISVIPVLEKALPFFTVFVLPLEIKIICFLLTKAMPHVIFEGSFVKRVMCSVCSISTSPSVFDLPLIVVSIRHDEPSIAMGDST